MMCLSSGTRVILCCTYIMDQNARACYKVCVVILDMEIVDSDWCFENLVLNLLNNYILAVDQNQYVAGTELCRLSPSFDGGVERMSGCCYNFFLVHENMDQLVCFIDIGLDNLFDANRTGSFIPCPYLVASLNLLNGYGPCCGQNSGSGYKAIGGCYRTCYCAGNRSSHEAGRRTVLSRLSPI